MLNKGKLFFKVRAYCVVVFCAGYTKIVISNASLPDRQGISNYVVISTNGRNLLRAGVFPGGFLPFLCQGRNDREVLGDFSRWSK